MSSLQAIVNAVDQSDRDGFAAMKYKKGSHSTGEGDQYEERMLALVFLRCLRRGLLFQLSANNVDGGKFDDVVLVWRTDGQPKARILLVQLKHKTSQKGMTLYRDTLLSKAPNCDFGLSKYCTSYRKICEFLERDRATFVLVTNACLGDSSLEMFKCHDVDSISGLDLPHAGGDVYKLDPNNQHVWQAVDGNTSFLEHFYLLCKQRNSEEIVRDIYGEVEGLLGAGDLCGSICDSLFKSLREWMNKQSMCLTRDWNKWQAIVDEYVRKDVTMTSMVTTRLEFCSVADVRDYINSCNPAWVRPPVRGTEALTATKVHQAIAHNTHIMVTVESLRLLQHKILCCWGQFCKWLVIVGDDDEHSSASLLHMRQQVGSNRRLVIVSYKGVDSFRDTCRSGDICDNTWKELADVKIKLNSEENVCCLKDLCDAETLKAVLDGKPRALVALSQVSGHVRLGQDLSSLPANHIPRQLTSRTCVREEFFSSLGENEVCIVDEVSYKLLTTKFVLNNPVTFEELENYLTASDAVWPIFVVTKNFDHATVHVICSKHKDILLYVLSYGDGGCEILFLHRGAAKIRPYVKERPRSLLQIVNGLGNRVIVEGKPGVGKSTMLLEVASHVMNEPLSWWVLRIDLLEYSDVFEHCDSGVEASKDILLRAVHNGKNLGILEHALLQHCLLEYPHIICLVDGFDEVCPDYADICIKSLQELAPRRGKLVVTTRPSVTDRLEAALGVLAHSLPAFNEDQLQRFHGWSRSETGVGPTDAIRELLKIPLFSRMYADSTESGIVVHDIVSLYEAFFERKFRRLHEEKWRNNLSVTGNKKMFERERREHEKQLKFLAVSHLVPRLEVPGPAQSSSIDRDDLVKAGVIYQFVSDKPVFIHRTFAEYFLAKWCFSDGGDDLRADVYHKALSDSSLEFFVESFDRMASRDRPVLMAVLNGRESELKSVLGNGADPTEVDNVGRNSLHLVAAYGRDSTLLRLLVERLEAAGAASAAAGGIEEVAGAAGPSQYVEAAGAATAALGAEDGLLRWTPLRYAAERRRWRAVAALLEVGARLRHLADFQRGLHSAEELWRVFDENGYEQLFLHILGQNEPAWIWQMVQRQGEQRSLEIKVGVTIISAEMSVDQYVEIMWGAGAHHHGEVTKLLWHKLMDMKRKSTSTGSQELLQALSQLENSREMPVHIEGLGSSSLWHLVKKQIRSVLQEMRTASGDAPVRVAAATDDAESVRRLVDAGADASGESAIYVAAATGNIDSIRCLLSAGVDVNVKDAERQTALHCAAAAGSATSVRLLLAAGADAHAQDSEGITPLHLAAISGNTECVRMLARAVRNLELTDLRGWTAMHYAAGNGDDESLKHLLRAGAHCSPVNRDLDTPLHLAAMRAYAECVRLLLQEKADVAARNDIGRTALHFAALSGNPDCVRQLLKAGAGVRDKDEEGSTPLHYLAARGSPVSVSLLLRKGADVHERDRYGRTPLHYAALNGKTQTVKLLLDAGADALVQDSNRYTPLRMAEISNNNECISLLTNAVQGGHGKTE